MIDFEKAAARMYAEASPEERARIDEGRRLRAIDEARRRVTVPAKRWDCFSGKERPVEIVLVVRPGASRPEERWLHIDEGGVTGYESMPISGIAEAIERDVPWFACHGTKGRWDRLEVPASSLRIAAEAFAEDLRAHPTCEAVFPAGAHVLVDGRDEAIVKQAFPVGSSSFAFPHYKLDFVGGDGNVAMSMKRVGIVP